MIKSYKNKETENVHNGKHSARLNELTRKALRKIDQVHNAVELNDLASPPGNRLEPMKSTARKGQHSIRINDKWRICFRWDKKTGDAHDVEIVDYHGESKSRHK